MDDAQIESEVDRILLRRAAGEELTDREHTILSYTYYAGSCSSCGHKRLVNPSKKEEG